MWNKYLNEDAAVMNKVYSKEYKKYKTLDIKINRNLSTILNKVELLVATILVHSVAF